MKNMIAMLLTFAMVLSLAACGQKAKDTGSAQSQRAVAEGSMSLELPAIGAWQHTESPVVPDEVKALLDKSLENLDGAVYIPVAYLGSQVVAGTNYALLCRVAPVVPDAVETYCIVYLYEDLEGNVEITQVEDSLASTDLSNEQFPDGWEQPESPELTEEARTALDKALEGFVGATYTPFALVSTQTQAVAGANYCILCECTITVPDAEPVYTLVYIYEDPDGNAELTQIVDFDGTTQISRSNEEETNGIGNPFVDYDSLETAEKAAGFTLSFPEQMNGYSDVVYQVMDGKMLQIIFQNGENQLFIRKEAGTEDISGDYTEYSEVQTISVGKDEVNLKGDNGTVSTAIWTADGWSYAVMADTPMGAESMTALVEQIS